MIVRIAAKKSRGRHKYDFKPKKPRGSSRLGKTRKVVKKKLHKLVNTKKECLFPALFRLARLAGVKSLSTLFTPMKRPCKLIAVKPKKLLEEASEADKCLFVNMIKQSLNKVKIVEVLKVNNPFLSAMYDLTKEEYRVRNGAEPEEKMLFHSTSRSNVSLIVEDNLDWSKVRRSKFGLGNCFSSDADYANCHANRRNGSQRAFVICKVLIGKKKLGSSCSRIPDTGFDTLTGSRSKEIVYVKFQDNEFLPVAVVNYDMDDSTISNSKYYKLPRDWFD